MEVITWVIANWAIIIAGVLAILGGASVLAKLTPTQKDDKVIDFLLKVLHGIALNPKADKARK